MHMYFGIRDIIKLLIVQNNGYDWFQCGKLLFGIKIYKEASGFTKKVQFNEGWRLKTKGHKCGNKFRQ